MAAFSSLLIFASLVSLWALFYFLVYSALRALAKSANRVMCVLGSLSLVLWGSGFGLYAWFAQGFDVEGNYYAYPTFEVIMTAVILLLTLGLGGIIMRLTTQKQLIWWHGSLFCALYLTVAYGGFVGSIAAYPGIGDTMWRSFEGGLSALGIPAPRRFADSLAIWMFVWLFPFVAPFFEWVLRSFWRTWQQSKTGAFS